MLPVPAVGDHGAAREAGGARGVHQCARQLRLGAHCRVLLAAHAACRRRVGPSVQRGGHPLIGPPTLVTATLPLPRVPSAPQYG